MVCIDKLGCGVLNPVHDKLVFAIPVQIADIGKMDCLAGSLLERDFKVVIFQNQHRFGRLRLLDAADHGFHGVVPVAAAVVLIVG